MTREQLEHLVRAAAAVTNSYELVVIGSQSLLGAVPDAPASLRESMEADLYPLSAPALADLIDGAIGEGSALHDHYGYYAQGVGPDTAILPEGWQARLVRIQNTDLKVGLCLDPVDLVASKLAAGREKDFAFARTAIEAGLVPLRTLRERVATLPVDDRTKQHLQGWTSRFVDN